MRNSIIITYVEQKNHKRRIAMKSLESVQKWMKAFKIIAKVVMIVCIVTAVMMALAVALGDLVVGTLTTVGNVDIHGLLAAEGVEDISMATVRIICLCGVLAACVGIALSAIAVKFLNKELKAGTPFTYEFAKDVKTLAILFIVLPLAIDFISSIILNLAGISSEISGKIELLAALLLFAAATVFKYGADLLNERKEETENAEN